MAKKGIVKQAGWGTAERKVSPAPTKFIVAAAVPGHQTHWLAECPQPTPPERRMPSRIGLFVPRPGDG